MSKPKKWIDLVDPIEVERGGKSRIRLSIIKMNDCDEVHVAIREHAQFTKKEERSCGLRIEDMPFRPTQNGLTFRIEKLDEVIESLIAMRDESFDYR